MRTKISAFALLLALSGSAQIENQRIFDKEIPQKAEKEFQFIAYSYTQFVSGNYYPTNDFLRGQIFGRLFGQNTTTTSSENTTAYVEQRFLPFFIYQPKLLNGKAILRASFEIDYTWGDAAYGAGGNFGGAIASDQVNIQTQNVSLELKPFPRISVLLGLQRMFDNPNNPYRTLFDQLTGTGYRLTYWGTDASGLNIRYDGDFERAKIGFWQFWENNVHEKDDVIRLEAMYEKDIATKWKLGFSADYVRDRANGEGGPSILGQGLNSTLTDYNGLYRFPLGGSAYKADVFWTGSFFTRNADYSYDRYMLTGFLNFNFGRVDTAQDNNYSQYSTLGGLGANLKMGYRYGMTAGDVIQADLLFASGDANGAADGHYTGVMTGNYWGTPVSLFIRSGAYILFPHGNVVNRFVSLVNDPSNLGYGVSGLVLNYYRDLIPNKLNWKIGAAAAVANIAPANGGYLLGTEGNTRLSYTIKTYMQLECHAAYCWLGDFYDSESVNGGVSERPVNPWTIFMVYKWLMF